MNCFQCKKSSHVIITCKCGNHFCVKHIVGERHNCNHNYRLEKDTKMIVPIDHRIKEKI